MMRLVPVQLLMSAYVCYLSGAMTSTPNPSHFITEGSLSSIQISPTMASKPGSAPGFYNPKRRIGRDFVVLSVANWLVSEAVRLAYKHSPEQGSSYKLRPARLLDATCATGIQGLRAAVESQRLAKSIITNTSYHDVKPLSPNLQVILNDVDENAVNLASKNVDSLLLTDENQRGNGLNLTVTERCAQALMHEETFEVSVLDPFGSVLPFLDAALARSPNRGLIEVCATDVGVLYGTRQSVAKRHYHAHLARQRPPCYRERGVRLLIAAIAQAAGRHDRGIVPIYSISTEHFCLVSVKVFRGANAADATADNVQSVRICRVCGAAGTGIGSPQCGCEPIDGAGIDAQEEGPLWVGPLQDADALDSMANIACTEEGEQIISKEARALLDKLRGEATVDSMFHRRPGVAAKGMTPKLNRVMEELTRRGLKTSRTHFCGKSLKTNASAKEFDEAIQTVLSHEKRKL